MFAVPAGNLMSGIKVFTMVFCSTSPVGLLSCTQPCLMFDEYKFYTGPFYKLIDEFKFKLGFSDANRSFLQSLIWFYPPGTAALCYYFNRYNVIVNRKVSFLFVCRFIIYAIYLTIATNPESGVNPFLRSMI